MQFAVGYQRTYNTILEKIGKVAGVAGDVAGSDRRGEAQGIAIVLYLIGAIALLTRWLVGLGSEVVLMGLSRSREFHADAVGAALTSPAAMESALVRVHAMDYRVAGEYSHFMFFGAEGLLATHPSLEARTQGAAKGP